MSARFKRGSSVLAALVLVTLVGGVAFAIHSLATPSIASTPSQLAAADAGTAGSQTACTAGYDYRVQETSGKPETTPVKVCPTGTSAPSQQIKTGSQAASAVLALSTGTFGALNDPTRCELDPQRPGTMKPKSDYKCKVQYCISVPGKGNECKEADNALDINKSFDAGAIRSDLRTPLITDLVSQTPADQQKNLLSSIGVSSAEQSALNNAFETKEAQLDTQITANNKELEALKQYINSCDTGSDCPDVDQKFQRASDLEKQNADLQKQADALSEAQKQDLTAELSANTKKAPEGVEIGSDKRTATATSDEGRDYLQQQGYSCSKTENYYACTNAPAQGPCQSGSINPLTGSCGTNNTFQQKPGGGVPEGNPGAEKSSGFGGGFGSALQGILGSLAKAVLGKAIGGALGSNNQNCTNDQNQYNSQQQQYQQQMQLYNQQLQQYNYQAQIAQMQGYPPPPQPIPPQQPCFNQSSGAVQCSGSPAQPTSGCDGTWRPTTQSGNSCISGWQCVPSSGSSAPTAQISCQPKVADVGMSIAISFSCGNSTSSAGSGFDTGNKLSGSATTTIQNPPAGATKVTYGVQCVNGSTPATAQCGVDISRPSIILVANPKVVKQNASSTIGWLTTGMQSCTVSSPDLPEFTAQNALQTSVNGTAITPALTESAEFDLDCVTLGGGVKSASTTVQVGAPTVGGNGGISVTSSSEGFSIPRGSISALSWNSGTSTASSSKLSLWVYDVELEEAVALIKDDLSPTGTYSWKLPKADDPCDYNSPQVCGIDLVPGREYAIEAVLYSPAKPDEFIDYGYSEGTFGISS